MKNTQRRSSNKKKLVSAISMLTVSAVMLSTATYAWFTMSKEVELKNIQMTATVPEDLQISLGALTSGSLTANTGTLGTTAATPGTTQQSEDWSNSADISKYYQFGKLIPASSKTGGTIIKTDDANGVGKTVSETAVFTSTTDQATLHSVTAKTGATVTDTWIEGGQGGYTKLSSTSTTNDDGYYVDIPVWFRTSTTAADVNLKVTAVSSQKTASTTTEKIYKAVRVAILDGSATASSASGIVPIWGEKAKTNQFDDYYGDKGAAKLSDTAVENGVAANAGTYGATTTIYEARTAYNGTSAVVTVPKSTTSGYGNAVKATVRVWIEGEDPDCWNATAGQDFDLSLYFEKI